MQCLRSGQEAEVWGASEGCGVSLKDSEDVCFCGVAEVHVVLQTPKGVWGREPVSGHRG
eukprot:CAMPEP_0173207704 /NCGR_PEP_ID=MMETSP1141-20130122/22081_1 /TAXON_ID=483371 /ORGANISM="non described non described, Strain CCMP2298" /LENGTH=58 /DNA_ID=CAMNT_0014134019 /DNA_START=32 /DNA_END=204 /DNA_ORIENTATION=+